MWLALESQWTVGGTAGQPTSGGPLQACDVEIEEINDGLRLTARFRIGSRPVDPDTVRFILETPDGRQLEQWYPGALYLRKQKPGTYFIDLKLTWAGRFAYRFDSWGRVATLASGGFEMEGHLGEWTWTRRRVGAIMARDMRVAVL